MQKLRHGELNQVILLGCFFELVHIAIIHNFTIRNRLEISNTIGIKITYKAAIPVFVSEIYIR